MSSRPRVLLLSIDGLLPDLVLGTRSGMPFLASLASRGAYSASLEPIYPSVTFACHATVATGVLSSRHGIHGNTRFQADQVTSWKGGESQDWLFDETLLEAEPIWRTAVNAGIRTAVLQWPSTRGAAGLETLVPEVFPLGSDRRETWQVWKENLSPGRITEIVAPPEANTYRARDEWLARASKKILAEDPPELLLMHWVSADHEMHEHGRDSPEATEEFERADQLLRDLLDSIDLREWTVMILGDHGFRDFDARVNIQSMLREMGWIRAEGERITEWDAVAHTQCGAAGIYARSGADAAELIRDLEIHRRDRYQLITREELDRLGAFPGAVCALDALPGLSFGQKLHAPWTEPIPSVRSEHGYLATDPLLASAFIAVGAGVARGKDLGAMHLCDIAPTLSHWLAIEPPARASGHPPVDLSLSRRRRIG